MCIRCLRCWLIYFNPRSREGSDIYIIFKSSIKSYFNPRSREGSDLDGGQLQYDHFHFNPRSREGSDSKIIQKIFSFYIILSKKIVHFKNIFGFWQKKLPRSLKNLLSFVRIMLKHSVCFSFALDYDYTFLIKNFFCPIMLNFIFVMISKIIKSQTIFFLIYNFQQTCF